MKITALFLALCVSVACSTNLLANASEPQIQQPSSISTRNIDELKKTSFNLWVYWGLSSYWANFQWKDKGNGNVSLSPVSGGQYIDTSDISWAIRLQSTIFVKKRDENYKLITENAFVSGSPLRYLAEHLADLNIRLGKDSIQILSNRERHIQVLGKVEQFGDINFFDYPTLQQLSDYTFVPRQAGLRASYIHQDRIEEGKYRIAYEDNIYLTSSFPTDYNAYVHFGVDPRVSTWRVAYDNDKRAYRILLPLAPLASEYTGEMSLAWDPKSGNNVFIHANSDSSGQYWLFRKIPSENKYAIMSAVDVYNKFLNVDSDLRNVSVSRENHASNNQQFTFEKQ